MQMRLIRCWIALVASVAMHGQGAPVVQSVVNAADYSSAIIEGGYISIFGEGLAGATLVAQTAPFPTVLGGTSVEIRETTPFGVGRVWALPLYYVSPKQLSALIPYALGTSGVDVVVVNGTQRSAPRRVTPRAAGPRLFTYSQLGTGSAVLARANNELVTATTPVRPGEVMQLYLNSAGPVTPALTAGAISGDGRELGPLRRMATLPEVTLNGRKAEVSFAGMSPGSVGLYQINFRAPYEELEGDLALKVKVGAEESQNGVFVRTLPNGFYWTITAGQAQNGLELNGESGASSVLAFRHDDTRQWGQIGLRQWSKDTGLATVFRDVKGIALTLKNGGQIVFDNNGLESGNTRGYYDNRGGGPDSQKPGLVSMFSNSTRSPLVMAGAFRVTQAMTVTEVIGYFEGPSLLRAYPFFPENFFNQFRMNIWSNTTGNLPRETGDFSGDVFSSDRTAGKFGFGTTGVSKVFQNGVSQQIYWLRYELERPIVLEPGLYWFSHDVAVPKLGANPGGAAISVSGEGAVKEVLPGPKQYSMRDDE